MVHAGCHWRRFGRQCSSEEDSYEDTGGPRLPPVPPDLRLTQRLGAPRDYERMHRLKAGLQTKRSEWQKALR